MRVNIWLPAELGEAAKAAGLNISQAAQDGIRRRLGLDTPAPADPPTDSDICPPHPGWKQGSSGLTICKRCGTPKAMTS
jgi:hypothetical protein